MIRLATGYMLWWVVTNRASRTEHHTRATMCANHLRTFVHSVCQCNGAAARERQSCWRKFDQWFPFSSMNRNRLLACRVKFSGIKTHACRHAIPSIYTLFIRSTCQPFYYYMWFGASMSWMCSSSSSNNSSADMFASQMCLAKMKTLNQS